MSRSTKFTQSNAAPSNFDLSDPTSFSFSRTQLIEQLKSDGVASITVVSAQGRLTSLYSPLVITDEHNNDYAIQGNLSDNTSSPKFGQIDLAELGHVVSFTAKKPPFFSTGNRVSGVKVKGAKTFKGSPFARITPNFILLPFGQQCISGKIDDEETLSNVESWCRPAAEILDALHSAMSREEETEALFQAICESNKEDELLLPDFTAQRIEPKIPYVSIEYIDEEDDDVEVHPSLQERFKLRVNEPVPQPAPAPQPAPLPHQTSTQPSMNQQVILVRTEDSNRNQIQSQNAQARWALFFVCGDVSNLTPVTANNVSVPAFTSSFKNILQNPHASIRQDAMTDLITSVADQWAEEKGTTADITVVPDTFSKAILS